MSSFFTCVFFTGLNFAIFSFNFDAMVSGKREAQFVRRHTTVAADSSIVAHTLCCNLISSTATALGKHDITAECGAL